MPASCLVAHATNSPLPKARRARLREETPISCLWLLLAVSKRSASSSNALALLLLLLTPLLILLLSPSCLLSLLTVQYQEDKSGSETHNHQRLQDVSFLKCAQIRIGTGHRILVAVIHVISVIAHLIL